MNKKALELKLKHHKVEFARTSANSQRLFHQGYWELGYQQQRDMYYHQGELRRVQKLLKSKEVTK